MKLYKIQPAPSVDFITGDGHELTKLPYPIVADKYGQIPEQAQVLGFVRVVGFVRDLARQEVDLYWRNAIHPTFKGELVGMYVVVENAEGRLSTLVTAVQTFEVLPEARTAEQRATDEGMGRLFGQTLNDHIKRWETAPATTLTGRLVWFRRHGEEKQAAVVLAVGCGCEYGWNDTQFAELVPLFDMRSDMMGADERIAVSIATVEELELLTKREAREALNEWEARFGGWLPTPVRYQAGAVEEPLTREALDKLLADFAAEVTIDVEGDQLDWSARTRKAADRIARRAGIDG